MKEDIIKEISIGDYDEQEHFIGITKDIGAKVENLIISRDNNNKIIKTPTVTGTESLAEWLYNNELVIKKGTGVSSVVENPNGENSAAGNYSHAEGYGTKTTAEALYSHAEGNDTEVSGAASHAEGANTESIGIASHAEGNNTTAEGAFSHSEGTASLAYGEASHAEGYKTIAEGENSHAEGSRTHTVGKNSHTEGGLFQISDSGAYLNNAGRPLRSNWFIQKDSDYYQASTDLYSRPEENYFIISEGTPSSNPMEEEFLESVTDTLYVLTEDETIVPNKTYYTAESVDSEIVLASMYCISETHGNNSHAEGCSNASGECAHAEGGNTHAYGDYSHSEGHSTRTNRNYAHAEGMETEANGDCAHAEGFRTHAIGGQSHAEGEDTYAYGEGSHVEGSTNYARGYNSHAEGNGTVAQGNNSHAEGFGTRAIGQNSHAAGFWTSASAENQTVIGKYNIEEELCAFIVGNGIEGTPSNALTLDWNGNLKATSYTNFSSRKYKDNIQDMTEEEAKKILQLNPVSFDYKSDKLPNNQFGLIAEDVNEIMTYPIIYKNEEPDAIDYSKFVPALIKMIQIQQKEIDELKNK